MSTAATWLHRRTAHLPPTVRGLLWAAGSGALFCLLNATMRGLAQQLHPMQAQFLRYLCGALVMLPLVWRAGWRGDWGAYWPRNIPGQFTRGAVHTVGLILWFVALTHIPLADTTAIGFTGPIFIMLGAGCFLKEPMRWERWVAAAIGFAGVMLVVGPKLGLLNGGTGGGYHLLMLASAPVFAASFLITKVLTRSENAGVIVVWQAISVTLFSIPMAWWTWQSPSALQWAGFALCGLLGSGGHYCLTRSFSIADISSTQSVKFLDLIWSSALGWLMFADVPTQTTLLGGAVICASTLWVARREHSAPAQPEPADTETLTGSPENGRGPHR
jgi:drug/metabolite transporter (DMT)-like permease